MLRRLLAAVLAALLVLAAVGMTAQARPLPAAASCTGVWVVVDSSTLERGTTATMCATTFDTGTGALRSAGFEVRRGNGMICAIDGLPTSCRFTTQAYWSYWQAARNADGSYGPWTYAQLGPDTYQPKQGDAEGWAFGAGEPPGIGPPAGEASASPSAAAAPAPSPSATPAPAPASTPTGLLLTAGVLVVGALAAGGWWWRTRTLR